MLSNTISVQRNTGKMNDDDLPDYWGEICPDLMHFDEDDEYVDPDAGDYVYKRKR